MSVKDTIYNFCKLQNRPLTGREIVDFLYPGKSQPYVNSYITQLVYEKKLVRNDSDRPYTVRLPLIDEEIIVQNYSRTENSSNKIIKEKNPSEKKQEQRFVNHVKKRWKDILPGGNS